VVGLLAWRTGMYVCVETVVAIRVCKRAQKQVRVANRAERRVCTVQAERACC
jgi:hypothetical protein